MKTVIVDSQQIFSQQELVHLNDFARFSFLRFGHRSSLLKLNMRYGITQSGVDFICHLDVRLANGKKFSTVARGPYLREEFTRVIEQAVVEADRQIRRFKNRVSKCSKGVGEPSDVQRLWPSWLRTWKRSTTQPPGSRLTHSSES